MKSAYREQMAQESKYIYVGMYVNMYVSIYVWLDETVGKRNMCACCCCWCRWFVL